MPARREIRVEDSWRVVDGENDSFETTVLPSLPSDSSSFLQPLSDSSQSFNQTQQSSDSIGDFARHHAEQDVIKREPFRPSVASLKGPFRTPDPEFRMPRLDAEGASRRSSGRSSRTVVPAYHPAAISTGSPVKRGRRKPKFISEPSSSALVAQGVASWALSIVLMAFNYARRPLALLLAVYLSCGALIMTQNMLQRSVSASLSPLCRLPGASFLRLPFCPDAPSGPVEFDQLVNVQAKFEDVLAQASEGVSLPFEMKRSETALRDLRTLLRHSEVQARDELVFEVDGYIEASRQTAADLQRFNAHVGSAVDSVISINRWTSRYLDTLEPLSSSSSTDLSIWSSWVFSPFQPSDHFSEAALRTQYVEHTALVSERIATLILEAQAVLRLLSKAEDHLSLIHEVSSRSEKIVSSRRDQVFWTVWTLLGANSAKLSGLAEQLSLLRKIEGQRSAAVHQLSALVVELEGIQAGLGDLRERVAEPALLREKMLPLSVHIETIDRGVERLDAARKRIRAAEDDRVKETLGRSGIRDERLLEAHGEL